MDTYNHIPDAKTGGTTITNETTKVARTLTGDKQLMFLRDMAYLAGDAEVGHEDYTAGAMEIRAKYFDAAA